MAIKSLFDEDYLIHYGKGHDDNPPGRGSGRYPYGSKNNAVPNGMKKGLMSLFKKKQQYFNPDGTINSDGLKLLTDILPEFKDSRNAHVNLEKYGMHKTDNGYVIDSDSMLFRFCHTEEELDSRRKYVAITNGDTGGYAGMQWPYMYTYATDKPIKIAPADYVLNYIGSQHVGNSTIKDVFSIIEKGIPDTMSKWEVNQFVKKYGDRTLSSVLDNAHLMTQIDTLSGLIFAVANNRPYGYTKYADNATAKVSREMADNLVLSTWLTNGHLMHDTNFMSGLEKAVKRDGYNGVIDVEDLLIGFECPMIVYEPDKFMHVKKMRQYKEDEHGRRYE